MEVIFKNDRLHKIKHAEVAGGSPVNKMKKRNSESVALALEISEQKLQEKILKKKGIRISESTLRKKTIIKGESN